MGTTVELDDLPELILHHILSFLTGKEAAQTTPLSRSWRKAWFTRPNLAFEREYDDYKTPIVELATKTIQRYEESNLRIQSLTLRVSRLRRDEIGFPNELIAKSLKLGATHLNINVDCHSVFPHDIVFGSEKLVGLSVENCKIETGSSEIRCSGLESLCLSNVDISLETLSNIISSCPSIRKLSLTCVRGGVDEESVNIRSVGLGMINLHSLTCLELGGVKFDTLFFGDMSSRFPSLKDLTIHTRSSTSSQDKEVIRISSRSLERLIFSQEKEGRRQRRRRRFAPEKRLRFKFDVPRIRRFNYVGSGRVIPLLSFESTSREWESRVCVTRNKIPDSSWLLRLNKFLTKLRRSKIHVYLSVGCAMSFDYETGVIQGLRKRPRVENLTVDVMGVPNVSCYAIFDGLFQLCRPKMITQYLHPDQSTKANSEYFLCKAFLERPEDRGSESFLYYGSFLYIGLRDLEEVNAEVFDKELLVWRHVPLSSLLDEASTSLPTSLPTDERIKCHHKASTTDDQENCVGQKIRFQLKWKRKPRGAGL